MAHTLTEDELATFREAFARWDTTGAGSIRMRDVGNVMELLGQAVPREDQLLFNHPEVQDQPVSFDEFLTLTLGPQWEPVRPDPEKHLYDTIAAFDDGNGYVPLRDLMRIVCEHMEMRGSDFTGGELVDICREALDGSLLADAGGSVAPETMWKVFEEEFGGRREGHRMEDVNSVPRKRRLGFRRFLSHCRRLLRGNRRGSATKAGIRNDGQKGDSVAARDRAGYDGHCARETAHMINLTVVDLGGKQLMFDAVASMWSVQALQQHIEEVVGVPVHRQFLSLTGENGLRHELCHADACLSKAGVVDGSTLLLVVKDEVKLDYKRFVSRFMDVEFRHAMARLQNHGAGV